MACSSEYRLPLLPFFWTTISCFGSTSWTRTVIFTVRWATLVVSFVVGIALLPRLLVILADSGWRVIDLDGLAGCLHS